jgi:phosphohistidine phosphatase
MLRHAEAADGSPDFERPLTERGEQQARWAGAAMAALGVRPDACLTSPKVRARDTARIVCELIEKLEPEELDELSGGPFDPVELVAGRGDDVLLVGHDPDFSMALHRQTGAQARMKKGGLAAFEKGELKLLLRPRELRAIAGEEP